MQTFFASLRAAAAPSVPTSGDPSAPKGTAGAGLPDASPRSSAVAFAFARAAFQQRLAYRVANLAGVFTNVFFLLFRAALIAACFAAKPSIGGMSLEEAVAYTSLTQALLMVIPAWGAVGVAAHVRSGQIAVELLRPVDYVVMHFGGRVGTSAYYVLARFLPVLAVAAVTGLVGAPAGPGALVAFVVSVALGSIVANAILFLIDVSSFWLESERGVRYLVTGFAALPTGLLLPLSWYPAPMRTFFLLTPFPYTLHLPAETWLGRGSALGLGVQLVWAVALLLACRSAVTAGTRRLQIAGG